MIELYILLGAVIFAFLILFIKHKIELYIDNRRFMKEVNQMIEKNNKRFDDALKKGLEESIPLITDFIKKQRELENERQDFVSDSAIECEKHSWVKMANGRWCEKCNKWSEHYR